MNLPASTSAASFHIAASGPVSALAKVAGVGGKLFPCTFVIVALKAPDASSGDISDFPRRKLNACGFVRGFACILCLRLERVLCAVGMCSGVP